MGNPKSGSLASIEARRPKEPSKRGQNREWLADVNNAMVAALWKPNPKLAAKLADIARPHVRASQYIHHNAACAFALVGRYDDALEMCRVAVEMKYKQLKDLKTDKQLGPLLKRADFKALFSKNYKPARSAPATSAPAKPLDAKTQQEILHLAKSIPALAKQLREKKDVDKPDRVAKFGKPASAKALDALKKKFDALPEEYLFLLKSFNGIQYFGFLDVHLHSAEYILKQDPNEPWVDADLYDDDEILVFGDAWSTGPHSYAFHKGSKTTTVLDFTHTRKLGQYPTFLAFLKALEKNLQKDLKGGSTQRGCA